MGDDPPLGRTRRMLTEALPEAISRNLGRRQLSIDGSVYVAKQVWRGVELEKIPLCHGVEIRLAEHCSVVLPFAYPLVGGSR